MLKNNLLDTYVNQKKMLNFDRLRSDDNFVSFILEVDIREIQFIYMYETFFLSY